MIFDRNLSYNWTRLLLSRNKAILLSKTCQDLKLLYACDLWRAGGWDRSLVYTVNFTVGFSNFVLQKGQRHMISISFKTILVPYNFNQRTQHPMIMMWISLMNDVEVMSQQWISVLWTRCPSLLALNPVVHAVAFPGWKFKSGFEIYSFITGLIILISLH